MEAPPWLAFVEVGNQACGGAAIAPNVVLTAAHCVVDQQTNHFFETTQIRVVFSQDKPYDALVSGEATEDPVLARVTPKTYGVFEGNATRDDIALLLLRDPAPGTVRLAPLGQPRLVAAGRRAAVLGWGITGTGDYGKLLRAELLMQAPGYCGAHFRYYDASRMLCAWSATQTVCHGDSGSPLLVADRAGRPLVAGVVNFGPSCKPGATQYFANVAARRLGRFVRSTVARLQRRADSKQADSAP